MNANKLLEVSKEFIEKADFKICEINALNNEEIKLLTKSIDLDDDKLSKYNDYIAKYVSKNHFASFTYLSLLSNKIEKITNNEILADFWCLYAKSAMKINAALEAKNSAYLALELYDCKW